MSFQVYHSVKHGHMPWPLAVLYGVIPLLISMLLIDFVSAWKDAPVWALPGGCLIIGGSMYLSASATGAVVLHAAPDHASSLFGILLDGAAILAARFLMTAAKRAAVSELASFEAAFEAERLTRRAAEEERDTASCRAAESAAKAVTLEQQVEELTRKLAQFQEERKRERAAGNGGGKGTGTGNRKPEPVTGTGQVPVTAQDEVAEEAPADLDSEARVLWYLDRGHSASRAGVMAGLTDSRGRQIARLARPAPKGIDAAEES